MKQVLQDFKTGALTLSEVPAPSLRPEGVLVRTRASLISSGTERSVVEFGEKSLFEKARSRPDLVKQVLGKVQRDGVLGTYETVRGRLDQRLPLGYSSAGEVIEVGAGAPEFRVGDRVACAGGGYACHAEFAFVPRTLAVKIPGELSFEEAAFATVGAVAMQGVRQAEVSVGETVAVIGLGLLGRLTVQILKASGCRVFGCDSEAEPVSSALDLGCDAAAVVSRAVQAALSFTGDRGADRVIITAHSDDSSAIELAGELARDRAVVVAVGAVGMEIPRRTFYMKELEFRLSRSYGPGRYDASYEERGQDYPYSYVRWTAQRNMEAFLQLVSAGKVRVADGVSHRFPIARAVDAYALITGKTSEKHGSVILTYEGDDPPARKIESAPAVRPVMRLDRINLGVIGAGNFATATLLPAVKKERGIQLVAIASANGVTARAAADRYGVQFCASSAEEVIHDDRVNTVAILTRHHLHATQVISALAAGKNVFVEKPLALDEGELKRIATAYAAARRPFMVGFNRRFAPFAVALRESIREIVDPLMINIRVNAGLVPAAHWIHDPAQGGGRLIGEGCHFFDLLHFLADTDALSVDSTAVGRHAGDFHSVVSFEGGSVGTLTYVSSGDRSFGKESIEVFGGGLAARIIDFRHLEIRHGSKRVTRRARFRPDKGYRGEWQAFVAEVTANARPGITMEDACRSMRTTFAAHRSLLAGETVRPAPNEHAQSASQAR